MRQPHDSGDIIEIDVLDADPWAFGGSGASHQVTPRLLRSRPRWLVAAAAASIVAIITGVALWQPWQVPPRWRTFEAPPPVTSPASNRLLPAVAPGEVTRSSQPLAQENDTPTTTLGHLFAERGATFADGRWAWFEAAATDAADSRPATDADEFVVHGVAAARNQSGDRTRLEWGPIGGFMWRMDSNRLTIDESLRFAGAAGVEQGSAAVRSDADLGSLQPLAGLPAFRSAFALHDALTGSHFDTGIKATTISYVAQDLTVVDLASVAAPPDALATADFMFGSGTAATVHGLAAHVTDSIELGTVVTWLENGRLVAVRGRRTADTMLLLAGSIRPATGEQWLRALRPRFDANAVQTTQQLEISGGVALNGAIWRASVTLGNPMVTCIYIGEKHIAQSSCTFSTPLTPSTRMFPGSTAATIFVIAVVPIDEFRLVLRITDADGSVRDLVPAVINDRFTAIAAEVPADAAYALVDPST